VLRIASTLGSAAHAGAIALIPNAMPKDMARFVIENSFRIAAP
jgi:hypothetical protein